MIKKAILKSNREKSVLAKHPWIFSGAIESIIGSPQVGEPVLVCNNRGQPLGWGGYSPNSNIRIRMWNYEEDLHINKSFLQEKILSSINLRDSYFKENDALRIVYAESDGLPGLIIDKYENNLVVQFLSAGSEFFREHIISILIDHLSPSLIYERSDVEIRTLEGLSQKKGVLYGTGKPTLTQIHENGINFQVDLAQGQKTGFYLDQRRNRAIVSSLAFKKECLNCFCYTGGFSLNMMHGHAKSVVSIDSSEEALKNAHYNVSINNFSEKNQEWIEADVFFQLRKFRDQGRNFDLIVLDPPKFAPTKAQVEKASRAYKDINLLALKLLRSNGLLVTFSCSGGVSVDLFQKIITGAAQDAGKEVRILDWLYQDKDHPVTLNFPESFYLKGLVCQV